MRKAQKMMSFWAFCLRCLGGGTFKCNIPPFKAVARIFNPFLGATNGLKNRATVLCAVRVKTETLRAQSCPRAFSAISAPLRFKTE